MKKTFDKMASRVNRSDTRTSDLETEKRELFEKCLLSEQHLGDCQRDLELKQIKIDSLEGIIQKREQNGQKVSSDSTT